MVFDVCYPWNRASLESHDTGAAHARATASHMVGMCPGRMVVSSHFFAMETDHRFYCSLAIPVEMGTSGRSTEFIHPLATFLR